MWVDPEYEEGDDEHARTYEIDPVDVVQVIPLWIARAHEGDADCAQAVGGGDDDTTDGDDCHELIADEAKDDFVAGEGPHEDEEFGDEVEHTRKTKAGEGSEAEEHGCFRHLLSETTECGDVAGAGFVVDVAINAP